MRFIRARYFLPLFLLFICFFCILSFMGTIIKWGLVRSGEALVGARVEIDSVDVDYRPFMITVNHVQVTNPRQPMQNIFEVKTIKASVLFPALLQKKVIIPEMSVQDVSMNTARKRSGALKISHKQKDKKKSGKVSQFISGKAQVVSKKAQTQIPDLNPKAILSDVNSETQIYVAETRLFQTTLTQKWKRKLSDPKEKRRIHSLEQKVSNLLKKDTKELNGIADINRYLSRLNAIMQQSSDLKRDVNAYSSLINQDFKHLSQRVSGLTKATQKDYKNALRAVKRQGGGVQGLGEKLFRPLLNDRFSALSTFFHKLIYYKHKLKGPTSPKKERRYSGVDIHFNHQKKKPRFWLQKAEFLGNGRSGQLLVGRLRDLTTDQRLVQNPFFMSLQGKHLFSYTSTSQFSVRHDVDNKWVLSAKVNGLFIPKTAFYRNDDKHVDLRSGRASFESDIQVIKGEYKGYVDIFLQDMMFKTKGIPRQGFSMERFVVRFIEDANPLKVTVSLSGDLKDPHFQIYSDLDKRISRYLNSEATQRLNREKEKLRTKFDTYSRTLQSQLTDQFQREKNQFSQQINTQKSAVKALQSKLDKRVSDTQKSLQRKRDQKVNQAKKSLLNKIKF